MLFLASNGYRCIAHDRRGHGRSSQPWNGNEMNTYADDLATLMDTLNLKNAVLIGFSAGDGEVARYIGRHGTKRLAKAALVSAVPPLMLKTAANPGGLPVEVFDGIRANSIADPDSVRVSSHAQWQVCYYLKKGQTDKAREIADFAGEVYSIAGLTAKGVFMEATTNYDGAFEWLAKIEERYNEPSPLMAFCSRYKAQTGDSRFDSELQKRLKALFPKGMENVSMNDFHAEPTDGVAINGQNDLVRSFGLRRGDVIVAVGGIRTHTFAQYPYIRDLQPSPELNLIVWQDNAYHEIKASPPNRRFGVNFGDYNPNRIGSGDSQMALSQKMGYSGAQDTMFPLSAARRG
jgi:pimeloyl-ACP methyl ester carboxylesterase